MKGVGGLKYEVQHPIPIFRTSIGSASRTFFHSIASMTYFTKLFMAVFCAATLHATAADERVARTMAGKDYQTSLGKIRADELAALGECAKTPGPAANACMVQANGKRIRAKQETKEKMGFCRIKQYSAEIVQ